MDFRTKTKFTGFHEESLKYNVRRLSLYTHPVSEVTDNVHRNIFFLITLQFVKTDRTCHSFTTEFWESYSCFNLNFT